MGGCFSCKSSSTFKNVRVVHLNGYVEEFEQPIRVRQLKGLSAKHFVCTPDQLLSNSTSAKPLRPQTVLETGQVYLLLPFSSLEADVSPLDLASLSRRLTTIAKNSHCLQTHVQSPGRMVMACGGGSSNSRSGGLGSSCSWRPILDTIKERSFNMRSESDLQDKIF